MVLWAFTYYVNQCEPTKALGFFKCFFIIQKEKNDDKGVKLVLTLTIEKRTCTFFAGVKMHKAWFRLYPKALGIFKAFMYSNAFIAVLLLLHDEEAFEES